MKHLALLLLPALAACAENTADYPRLLPTDQILAEPVLSPAATVAAGSPETVETGLESRAADLRRRADALRRPVIEPGLRAQMDGG